MQIIFTLTCLKKTISCIPRSQTYNLTHDGLLVNALHLQKSQGHFLHFCFLTVGDGSEIIHSHY